MINPMCRYELGRKAEHADVMLHLGDQVGWTACYKRANTCKLF